MEINTILVSQIPVLLLGIGYFIKRIFDTKSKKIEINHTLFQQNRLLAINRFFESYAKAETKFNQIEIYQIVRRETNPDELNKIVLPTLNELDSSLFELRIYFDESALEKFKSLVLNLKTINETMLDLWLKAITPDGTIDEKVSTYVETQKECIEKNEKIFDELTKSLKDIFKT